MTWIFLGLMVLPVLWMVVDALYLKLAPPRPRKDSTYVPLAAQKVQLERTSRVGNVLGWVLAILLGPFLILAAKEKGAELVAKWEAKREADQRQAEWDSAIEEAERLIRLEQAKEIVKMRQGYK